MRKKRKINPKKANEKQIFIFSEGDTEKCYFKQLKQFFKKQNLRILGNIGQISGSNLDKINLQKESIYLKIKDSISFTKKDIKSTKSIICYLLDVDGYNRDSYTQKNIDFIKSNFEDENFKVFFSNKDFELWILLHFEEYKKENGKYIEKISKIIKREYKKGNCNIDFFRRLIEDNLKIAIENGQKLEKYQENRSQYLKDKNPYTEVYKIFKELED